MPSSDETVIVAPCFRKTCRAKLSPMPEPSGFVVKNGTNILSIASGKIPVPVS